MKELDKDLMTASQFLHNLGSIVHFTTDEKLKDIVILNPRWLTKMMSTVFTTKQHYAKNGILSHNVLPHIWKAPDYPSYLYPFFMDLLHMFEIAFTLNPSSPLMESFQGNFKYGSETNLINAKMNQTKISSSSKSKEGGSMESIDFITVTQQAPVKQPGQPQPALSLLPSLLPEEKPHNFRFVWPPLMPTRSGGPDDQTQKMRMIGDYWEFRRYYQFEFIPKGFFARVMVRLLDFNWTGVTMWRYVFNMEEDT